MRLRRRQKCGIIFDAWKRCSFSIKHARLAFLGRMTHVLHFHRLKTSFADLKFNARNNKLIRNITLYMSLTQQSKLFQAWRRLFQQKRLCMSVIDKMLLNMTKFSMHRAWNHWRVVIGPARRIQQIVIMKYGWFRWKKLFIAVCYRNKRLYQMCFQHWMKLNKGIEERAKQLRRNRNIVVKVVHRSDTALIFIFTIFIHILLIHYLYHFISILQDAKRCPLVDGTFFQHLESLHA